MSWLSKINERFSKNLKFSVSNPDTFEEELSFRSNFYRVISLGLLLILLIGFLSLLFFANTYVDASGKGNVSIQRSTLEEQYNQIDSLSTKLLAQERYINAVRLIMLGEVPVNSDIDSLKEISNKVIDSLYPIATEDYKILAEKVKDDIRTNNEEIMNSVYFMSPVLGVVSQKFDQHHKGIDVVTQKGEVVKACLTGTVIYADYTRKDGFVVIIDHTDGFLSVYKHNSTVLKEVGSKVKTGDPVAIVGNTGENTDGPHLHFELWFDQQAVNPSDYINFTSN